MTYLLMNIHVILGQLYLSISTASVLCLQTCTTEKTGVSLSFRQFALSYEYDLKVYLLMFDVSTPADHHASPLGHCLSLSLSRWSDFA